MKKILLLLICQVFASNHLLATHNRAGEIIYNQVDANTIEAFIYTYTVATSIPADRDSLTIHWGDGSSLVVYRINGQDLDGDNIPEGEPLINNVKKNIYAGQHTYDEMGEYTLSVIDPNRNEGILNINFPNSGEVDFSIQTTLNLFNGQSEAFDNAPILLEAPVDVAYLGQPFQHVPNAYDLDGDSIAYEMAVPMMAVDTEVPQYVELTEIGAGPNNNITFDPETGLFTWDAPQIVGIYGFAMWIVSYRNGVEIGRILRDIQIDVIDNLNLVPTISQLPYPTDEVVDVYVGENISFAFEASDQDNGQVIKMSSTSGLYFDFSDNANFTFNNQYDNEGSSTFNWTVTPEHYRTMPYQVVFKVTDLYNDHGLASFKVLRFRVLFGPNTTPKIENESFIKIASNPVVSDDLRLISSDVQYPINFQVIDVSGKILKSGILHSADQIIDLTKFANGSYFLYLNNKDFARTEKFIKIE